KRLRLLFPDRRSYLELPASKAALATAPPLNLYKMYKTGTELLEGQPCSIYEQKGEVTQRLWVPDVPETPPKKKLFFFLREVTITPRGATQADVSEVRFADQAESLFRVPDGYRRQ